MKDKYFIIVVVLVILSLITYAILKSRSNYINNFVEKWTISNRDSINTYNELIELHTEYMTNYEQDKKKYDDSFKEIEVSFYQFKNDDSIDTSIKEIVQLQNLLQTSISDLNNLINDKVSTPLPQTLVDKINIIITSGTDLKSKLTDISTKIVSLKELGDKIIESINTHLNVFVNHLKETVESGKDIINIFHNFSEYTYSQSILQKSNDILKSIDADESLKSLIKSDPVLLSKYNLVQENVNKINKKIEEINATLNIDQTQIDYVTKIMDDTKSMLDDINIKKQAIDGFKSDTEKNLLDIAKILSNLDLSKNIFVSNIDITNSIQNLKDFYNNKLKPLIQ